MNVLIVGTDFNAVSHLKTQGQFLCELLLKHKFNAWITSRYTNYLLRLTDTVFQIVKLNKKDIAILQLYSSKVIYLSFVAAFLCRLKGVKMISTLHGGNLPMVYFNSSIKKRILDYIFRVSTAITAPSDYIPHEIKPLQSNEKVKIIRNLIHLNDYKSQTHPKDKIRLFWMRAYHPIYDPMKAVEVLQELTRRNIDANMVMAGNDLGLLSALRTYIAQHQLEGKIEVYGIADSRLKHELAQQSNIYLSTNTTDNAPVSFLEMMALGLPVVSTCVGGIPYYVEHMKTAMLSTDNSASDLCDQIILLHHDNLLYEKLVMNAKQFILEFSEPVVAGEWLHLLSEVTQPDAY